MFMSIVPLIIVGYITFRISTDTLTNHVQTSYNEIIRQVSEVMNVHIQEIDRKLRSGNSNSLLLSELQNKNDFADNDKDNLELKNDDFNSWYIRNYLQTLYLADNSIESSGIISKYTSFGTSFSNHALGKYDFFSTDIYKKIKNANGKVFWQPTQSNQLSNSNKIITAGVLFKHLVSDEEIGVCVINFKPDFFRRILNKVSIKNNISLFILSKEQTIISDIRGEDYEGTKYENASLINEIKLKGSIDSNNNGFIYNNNNLVFYNKLDNVDWTLIAIVPDKILKEPSDSILSKIIFIAIFTILLSIFVAYIMTNNILYPLNNIINVLKTVEFNDMKNRCIIYGKDELSYLATSLNKMLDTIVKSRSELTELNLTLEEKIGERTKQLTDANNSLINLNTQLNESHNTQKLQNIELSEALSSLQTAQAQLISSEKMAALGGLVAGMAHEINTPIGVGVTAVTLVTEKSKELISMIEKGAIKKSTFENSLKTISESSLIAYLNLSKASELIQSFKRVSVDISYEDKRPFYIKELIQSVIITLSPEMKGKKYDIDIMCEKDIEIYSYPSILIQVTTNLIVNSIIHGFERGPTGAICFDISYDQKNITIVYTDNGKGISEENISKVFDPFFTTKRNKGGTGLGLNIVYNLVTQSLNGQITLESKINNGVKFTLFFPYSVLKI